MWKTSKYRRQFLDVTLNAIGKVTGTDKPPYEAFYTVTAPELRRLHGTFLKSANFRIN